MVTLQSTFEDGQYKEKYETRERKIVWLRYYPYTVVVFFLQSVLSLATILSLNFTTTSLWGGALYIVTFRWLTGYSLFIIF
jgi:hypothetical protein